MLITNQSFNYVRYNREFIITEFVLTKFDCILKIYRQVTKAKNIKTDSPKILKPTHFWGTKDNKANKVSFGLIPGIIFF